MGLSDLIAGGMDATAATELLLNVVWTIVGATLVYFMQAGFAMCEAGFTRAKNTGNILMKNMMDFVLGSLFFFIFGFAIMHGTDWNGIIGIKGFFNPTTLADADGLFNGLPIGVFLIFHTVFCATSATIVSGSMAERTKFLAYLLYSAAISIFIYPVTGHWIWGGGWLAQMGFHDFAGSTGSILVGVFSPEYTLKTQVIGVLSTVAYVLVMAIIVFTIIDKTVGLRVTKGEELDGLDIHEHGCSAYADFNFRL